MSLKEKNEMVANRIIAEMQDFGLTSLQMLEVIALARVKFIQMKKNKKS